ncbi:hypothetical protein C1645_321077 [Glomus cerebriforme]|uniref:Uncharacterized protein n=1 Tax=Glomus cerebriforme TaxID=658196 RepID=A0A397SKQ9_9GLOM|nr:hypothetical protein C1645_321077 [Glomus cerebriforme]
MGLKFSFALHILYFSQNFLRTCVCSERTTASIMPGETSNGQSNFNKQEVSLYAHLYEKYVEIKNVDGTDEITPDKYNCHNGGVVLEYVDCRSQPTCTGKRIFLRQNTTSVWDDVLRMCQDAGGTWTQEMAIQVESQLLV